MRRSSRASRAASPPARSAAASRSATTPEFFWATRPSASALIPRSFLSASRRATPAAPARSGRSISSHRSHAPLIAATISGVFPSELRAVGSAPASSNSRTTARGFGPPRPSREAASAAASSPSRAFRGREEGAPAAHATWSAVHPFASAALTAASSKGPTPPGARRTARVAEANPLPAANMSGVRPSSYLCRGSAPARRSRSSVGTLASPPRSSLGSEGGGAASAPRAFFSFFSSSSFFSSGMVRALSTPHRTLFPTSSRRSTCGSWPDWRRPRKRSRFSAPAESLRASMMNMRISTLGGRAPSGARSTAAGRRDSSASNSVAARPRMRASATTATALSCSPRASCASARRTRIFLNTRSSLVHALSRSASRQKLAAPAGLFALSAHCAELESRTRRRTSAAYDVVGSREAASRRSCASPYALNAAR